MRLSIVVEIQLLIAVETQLLIAVETRLSKREDRVRYFQADAGGMWDACLARIELEICVAYLDH